MALTQAQFETPHEPREKVRAALVAANVPRRYSAALHLLFPSAIGFGLLALAIKSIDGLKPWELWTVPLTYVSGLGLEWRLHKDALHRRLPLVSLLYERHEKMHHVIYTHEDMAVRSPRELSLVLLPAFAIVAIAIGMLPLVLGVMQLVSKNCAMLFLGTAMMFFLSYEWLHAAYHVPLTSRVGRSWLYRRLIGRLREQHRRHHDPRLMKRWNFNVTIPLFDLIHGTLWSEERAIARRRTAAKPASGPAPSEEVA